MLNTPILDQKRVDLESVKIRAPLIIPQYRHTIHTFTATFLLPDKLNSKPFVPLLIRPRDSRGDRLFQVEFCNNDCEVIAKGIFELPREDFRNIGLEVKCE